MNSDEVSDSLVIATYKPRGWRYLARAVAITAVFVAVGFLLTHTSGRTYTVQMAPYPVAVFVLLVVGDLFRRYPGSVIRLSATNVSGCGFWPERRHLIPLRELDRSASVRRSVLCKLLGGQYLRSLTGDRIYLHRWAFAGDDMRSLLDTLGLNGESARQNDDSAA